MIREEYNYYAVMKQDIADYIDDVKRLSPVGITDEELKDSTFCAARGRQDVTGDVADKDYYFENEAEAAFAVNDNKDLLELALESRQEEEPITDMRHADYCIRTYLLEEIIDEMI